MNGRARRYRLDGSKTEEPDVNFPESTGDYRNAGFIDFVDNNIYFYSDISQEKIVYLVSNLKKMSDECLLFQRNYNLSEPPAIHLYVNSYGGSLDSGIAALDHIRKLQVPIYTFIDGVCASAATLLTIAGTKRFINKNSFMMIHQLSANFYGPYSRLVDEMENATRMMETLCTVYEEYANVPRDKIKKILENDVYFTSEEALQYGFVDEIV